MTRMYSYDADVSRYNCCASVESAALPKLAYGCSGWDFGSGKSGLVGSLPSVVPESSLAGGNQQNNHPGLPPDGAINQLVCLRHLPH